MTDSYEFPRIEGKFTPGIYRDIYLGIHYKLKDTWDLSKMCLSFAETGIELDEFKVLCHKSGIEIIDIENGIEETYKIIPAYPFSYFDLHCPICSEKIISYELTDNDSIRCDLKTIKCEHYIGLVEKKNNRYIKDSLEYLQLEYKIEQDNLFFMTVDGWKKALTYTPPIKPLISHWGTSSGADYIDVFLFLESD